MFTRCYGRISALKCMQLPLLGDLFGPTVSFTITISDSTHFLTRLSLAEGTTVHEPQGLIQFILSQLNV